jgi:uncharacterized protein (TIGR03437 family)
VNKLAFALFLGWQLLRADSPNIRVVNAADYLETTTLAPDSIVSIFGPYLAITSASAPDPANLPHTLAGVTVSIGNATLPLYVVTRTQINARIDPTIPLGPATLTIQGPAGTYTKDIVLAANSNPGIFSMSGSGAQDGSILNAKTFNVGPFTVTTNGAPTALAIFTTGLNLATAPIVTIGGVSVPVTFYGEAPCCLALQQINVHLTPALAGAGRVEVAVTSGGQTSNIVEVVILPSPGQGLLPPSVENQSRSREIASIAYLPSTGQALVADENDDVVRLVDIKQRKVVRTIALPEGAQPVALAVTNVALVAERRRGKIAVIDLETYLVTSEVTVGSGPCSIALTASSALVVNQDSDTVSVIDLASYSVTNINVGRGPRGIAFDNEGNKAYVTNEDDGTLSVINLANPTAAPATLSLPANSRPANIQLVPSLGLLVITEPSLSPSGKMIVFSIAGGTATTLDVNPDQSGGPSDVAIVGGTAYFASQAGGAVTIVTPLSNIGTSVPLTTTNVAVDLGVRALAVDLPDKLLLAANEGSGTIALIDLNTNQVVNRIDAVQSEQETVPHNDHSDRQTAGNAPNVLFINPASAAAGSTFKITVTGTNLNGVTNLFFVNPATVSGHGPTENGVYGNGVADSHLTATNIQVNAAGSQLTATITVAASVGQFARFVLRLESPNGDSSLVSSSANLIQIN